MPAHFLKGLQWTKLQLHIEKGNKNELISQKTLMKMYVSPIY